MRVVRHMNSKTSGVGRLTSVAADVDLVGDNLKSGLPQSECISTDGPSYILAKICTADIYHNQTMNQ